jgi:LPS-assembly protein
MNLRTICILSLLLFSGLLTATDQYALSEELPKKIPVTITADKLDYDRTTDVYIAVGHVKIEQQGIRLEADKVVLNNMTGEATAEGNVYLQDKGDVVHAEKLQVNLNTSEGVVTKGDLFMKKDNYHLKGDVIERRSATVYHVEHAQFTTCDDNDWYIKADEMNIDMERYATGNHVSVKVAGLPILYTPYLLFPVRRQSGFLIPVPGYSSKDGFFMDNAFFWAISDYKDMTFYSDYRERTGHGTGIEYRYRNSRDSSGQMYYKYWDVYHSSESQWNFRLQHQEEFAEDLSARADIDLVSDPRYYYDFEKDLELRSKPYIDSNAFYVERWSTAALYLMGQYSTDLTKTNENTIQKLPELRYTVFQESLGSHLYVNFDGSATNFYKDTGNSTRRVDFNPQLTASLGHGGFSIAPRAGFRATFYDRSANSAEPTERKYTYAGVDLNVRVSRIYGADKEVGIGRIRHSIEPTISYTYVPYIDQQNIPRFDSVDYIAAQNMTTLSLINRLTAHYKESKESPNFRTFDVMVFRLSQQYDLNVARNDPNGHSRSDILGELFIQTPKMFSLSANATYDTYSNAMSSRSIGATVKGNIFSVNLTEQYLQNPPTQFLIGGGSLKLGKWDVSTQLWRNVKSNETTQEEYGLIYTSQCWGIRMNYTIRPGETRFTVMWDLKGFGTRGYAK